MECLGPQCAAMLLDWLRARAAARPDAASEGRTVAQQGTFWASATDYKDEAPAIRTHAELDGAFEHLEYAVFRRYQNQLSRAERTRLDNSIRAALFKVDRFVARLEGPRRAAAEAHARTLRDAIQEAREATERLRRQAQRAELKLAQLGSLRPEEFEDFVAEIFESLGFEVQRCGGTGDEGADLRLRRDGLRGVVQCKYQGKAVVGSPELQKFLGTVHHTHSHKGFFVTTSTFSLAAERFVAAHPIELIDGPRLVELVQEAIGPGASKEPEPAWF
ncbi:MAG TPA: restriction endonuclease [Isosphaeraceae bacterium]